jgi:CRISPR type IV-associated protein Csf3
MEALRVVASIPQEVSLPGGPVALDALLGATIAQRDDLPKPISGADLVDISLPLERSACGRVWLASFSEGAFEARATRHINKRTDIRMAQAWAGPRFRRIDIATGANKNYRIPLETGHLEGGALTWWCLGDAEQIRDLLSLVTYIGKKRSNGLGKVQRWTVEPCEPWPGFPVLRDGVPLRTLPLDWPGVREDAEQAFRVLSPPYWLREREEPAWVPPWR